MTVIPYKPNEPLWVPTDSPGVHPSSVWLIHGNAHLCRDAYRQLIEVLIPSNLHPTNIDVMDNTSDSIADIVEKARTYSLLTGPKVVAVFDVQLTGVKLDRRRLMQRVRAAHETDDIKAAAIAFAKLMGTVDLSEHDLSDPKGDTINQLAAEIGIEAQWINDVIAFCRSNGLSLPAATGSESNLLDAIERGFPKGNYLVLLTDSVDKRKAFYRRLAAIGTIIDCSVPKGETRAARKAKEIILTDLVDALLKRHRKKMAQGALARLVEKTGFDPSAVAHNMEKLIAYVGQRQQIRKDDVDFLLKRTKVDPVFAFTNAIADRNQSQALFYMNSLLTAAQKPLQPEQILVAILNQIRKLLLAKSFLTDTPSTGWHAGCSFSQFKQDVLPAIQDYDRQLAVQLSQWDSPHDSVDATSNKKAPEKKGKQPNVHARFMLLANPNNPYPVFLLLKKAANFSMDALYAAYDVLHHTDRMIKSGSENRVQALERAVIAICQSTNHRSR